MTTLRVENLDFTFATDWQATKYDDWSFYRNQFLKQGSGIKAVDLLAIAPDRTCYLVEVKDYRHPDSKKPSKLPEAIASKVLMTLAAMVPAGLHANDPDEKEFAARVLRSSALCVVAHIELPRRHMPVVDKADLAQKLAQLLRAVHTRPKVVSKSAGSEMPWSVA